MKDQEYTCGHCGRAFASREAKQRHRQAKHGMSYLSLTSRERPLHRGPIECGFCPQTFANDHNAGQHRRMKHGARA
jgi:hypothetical protein